jgi:hypothetical protein
VGPKDMAGIPKVATKIHKQKSIKEKQQKENSLTYALAMNPI